jgi:hypothetical protein
MRLRLVLLCCFAWPAAALSACGGGDQQSSDPAELVPADVPVYLRADLRPEGEVRSATEDLVATISGKPDGPRAVRDLIDQAVEAANASSSGEDISFEKDVDPWLGRNAAAFFTDIAGDSPSGAALFETSDEAATRDFIDKTKEQGDRERSYEGADYLLDEDTAAGVVDGFLVVGDETAFKGVVDVSGGDDALAGVGEFSDAIDEAPGDSLADAYVGLTPIVDAVKAQSDPESEQALRGFLGDVSGKSVLASVVPRSDSVELQQRTDADLSFGVQPGDVSELIGSFPADSFAAFAVADIGRTIEKVIDRLESAGIPGLTRAAIDRRLSGAGLSVDELASNLEDVGLFAQGTDERSLEGALVITVADSEKAEDLVGLLSGLALASGEPGIKRVKGATGFQVSDPELGPKPAVLLVAGDRIALGYGTEATEKALTTSGGGARLSGDGTYQQAAAALGDDVDLSAYASVAPILRLAESFGAGSDSGYRKARPYLRRFTYLVTGSGEDGDLGLTKTVIGVER